MTQYIVKYVSGGISCTTRMTLDTGFYSHISDDAAKGRMKKINPITLEIQIAKQLLEKYPDATQIEIFVEESQPQKDNTGAVLGALVIALFLALIFAPLIVMLGMKEKFLLKNAYTNRVGEEWEAFKAVFIKRGLIGWLSCIGVIVLCSALSGKIAFLSTVGMIALIILLIGDIAYFALSLLLTKKYVEKKEG